MNISANVYINWNMHDMHILFVCVCSAITKYCTIHNWVMMKYLYCATFMIAMIRYRSAYRIEENTIHYTQE